MFPEGVERDSEFMFARMAEATYAAMRAKPGGRVLDTAAGMGPDSRALAERGIYTTNLEPSRTLTELEQLVAEKEGWTDWGSQITRVRAWGEALPFASESFDASFCKGSLDHFDDPEACIAEMARVTKRDGRVVLTVANMESISLELARFADRRGKMPRRVLPARRHYDAPADHITRYDARLLREHAERFIHIETWFGISLFWGNQRWARFLRGLEERRADRVLRVVDSIARRVPSWADLIVVAGHPRRPAPLRTHRP